MKNLTVFFVFALLTSFVQSQSLTETEITGTWMVVNVEVPQDKENQGEDFIGSYFDFYPDYKFQLRLKMKDENSNRYQETFRNTTWAFNQTSQKIELNDGKFPIKVSKNNNKVYFELVGTEVKLEVTQPI